MQASASAAPQSSPSLAPEEAAPYSTAGTDLSLFLQPSFDASAYVSSLIRDVDASSSSTNTLQSPTPSAGKHLQPPPLAPSTPAAADCKLSISLSPTSPLPTSASESTDPSARKREQAQEDLDLSLAISRLNLAIEELDRSISTQVTGNAPELLKRTSNLASMQEGVAHTRDGIVALDSEVATLRSKVHDPFVRLQELQGDLKVYDGAGELVARTGKVVGLARRLESQMEALFAKKEVNKAEGEGEGEDAVVGQVHGRDLSRAALLVAEITSILEGERKNANEATSKGCSLLDLKLVQDLVPTIDSARTTIVDYMEDMIVRGLRDLSPLMLGSSLQTAFNLGILPSLVKDLLHDLTEVVRERTAAAFDLESLSRQLGSPIPTLDSSTSANYSTYRSGRRTNSNEAAEKQRQAEVWSDALWKRLDSLVVVEMGAVCSKVYLLERVLKLKSDPDTGANFLNAALEVLGDKPNYTFWLTFAQSLQQQVATASGRSAWLAQLLSSGTSGGKGGSDGYPRLLRLFQEFFAKISVYTDIQYSATHQSPETVILLKSLATLEKAYVDKSTFRIAEGLSSILTGSRRAVSIGEEDAEEIVRLIANVLDTTRFDPLLSRATVDRCTALVDQFTSRLSDVVAKDPSAVALGDDEVTQAQGWNASLLRFCYSLAEGLKSVASDQDHTKTTPTTTTTAAIAGTTSYATTQLNSTATQLTLSVRNSILNPLSTHLRTNLANSMGKLHLQLHSSPSSSNKTNRGVSIDSTSSASSYASETCDTLFHLRDRLLPLYPSEIRSCLAKLAARHTVDLFLLHASILTLPKDEGESDRLKLKLATDMTELEFSLTQLLSGQEEFSKNKNFIVGGKTQWIEEESSALVKDEGELFKSLKVFRRVLFLSLEEVKKEIEEEKTGKLLRVILLLHILSRQQEGVLEKVIGGMGSKKGSGAKGEFVNWVLQEVGQGEKEGVLFDRIWTSAKDVTDEQSKQIVLLLESSS